MMIQGAYQKVLVSESERQEEVKYVSDFQSITNILTFEVIVLQFASIDP